MSASTEQLCVNSRIHLRDFGGIASSMRDCSSPVDFPKTPVFCKTKAQCVNIFNLFIRVSTHKSIVTMYHATLSEETKEFIYHHFTASESDLRCIVCTIALRGIPEHVHVCDSKIVWF